MRLHGSNFGAPTDTLIAQKEDLGRSDPVPKNATYSQAVCRLTSSWLPDLNSSRISVQVKTLLILLKRPRFRFFRIRIAFFLLKPPTILHLLGEIILIHYFIMNKKLCFTFLRS
jgi:hypothetical protein